jgi:hypothetical protein
MHLEPSTMRKISDFHMRYKIFDENISRKMHNREEKRERKGPEECWRIHSSEELHEYQKHSSTCSQRRTCYGSIA